MHSVSAALAERLFQAGVPTTEPRTVQLGLDDLGPATPNRRAGTVLRPQTVRGYAKRAGCTQFDILPIGHDLWRFYRWGR